MELRKERINKIKEGIKSIYEYSKEKNKHFFYFKSDFWKDLLKAFEAPEENCFKFCPELIAIFIKYNGIIEILCDKEKDKKIIKDIGELLKTDDLSYHLNEKLKIFLKNKKNETNNEINGFIEEYNSYYQEEKYKYKRDAYILYDLDFQNDIDNNDDDDYKKEH